MPDIDNLDTISKALAAIPSGLAILTCRRGGESTGMLTSWIQQAGFDPPMITVALRRGRLAQEWVEAGGSFVLNLLAEDPVPLFKHFARGFSRGEDAFVGLRTLTVDHGVELADALAVLSCRVVDTADAGDHKVYIAQVEAGRRRPDAQPHVHLRKNGLSY